MRRGRHLGGARLKVRGEGGEQLGVWLEIKAYAHKTLCHANTGKSVI